MKELTTYLNESLKTVERKKDYDIIQILDRKFKEGELNDDIFKKAIIEDIKTCFSLPDNKLNKDYDKVIDQLVQEEIDNKIKSIEAWAEKYYKTQARRDKYIQDTKDEIRENIIKRHRKYTIDCVRMQLNPISGFGSKGVVKDSKESRWGDYTLSSNTAEQLAKWFNTFGYRDKNGQLIDLRRFVVGWTINYTSYVGTECPKSNSAYLNLRLTKAGEAIVKKYNSDYDSAVSAYYDEKGSGGYTGD